MADAPLAIVSPDAEFVPFEEVRGREHVVVDGPWSAGTVLGLSHWPDGGVPDALAADTSAEIVVNYLDGSPTGPVVDIVTNNHFDEDGLLAAWLLLERPPAPVRAAAVAAATAGDFHTWTDPRAAWAALSVMASAERPTTPYADVLRALNRPGGRDPAGAITRALLPRVGDLLCEPERYRRLWEPRWRTVEEDIARLESGAASITDIPAADLAVVRADRRPERLAVHPRIAAMRVLYAESGGRYLLEHRYETWVRFASRPLPSRVDLTGLLPVLQAAETRPGTWRFEGVAAPHARLAFVDGRGAPAPSGLDIDQLVREIAAFDPPRRGSR